MKKLNYLLSALICISCSNKELEEKHAIEIGKKYTLQQWPDSAMLANLDSLLGSELIVKKKVEEKLVMTLKTSDQTFKPEDFQPGSKAKPEEELPRPKILSNEEKMERFLEVLDQWGQDPQNSKYFREIRLKEAKQSLSEILTQNYGSWTKLMPGAILEYQLRALNNGADFAELPAGTLIRLPKM